MVLAKVPRNFCRICLLGTRLVWFALKASSLFPVNHWQQIQLWPKYGSILKSSLTPSQIRFEQAHDHLIIFDEDRAKVTGSVTQFTFRDLCTSDCATEFWIRDARCALAQVRFSIQTSAVRYGCAEFSFQEISNLQLINTLRHAGNRNKQNQIEVFFPFHKSKIVTKEV